MGPDEMQRELAAYLTKRGLRHTAQRRVIAQIFFGTSEHLTVEEILARARKLDGRVGHATVYRTMKLLAESGLAHERRFDGGVTRYELAAGVAHHDHLICRKCGRITEFEDPEIERLQDVIARRYGWRIDTHRHELYGVCGQCMRRES
jgi:Fur family ferric uptake transcriptional regulator